MSEETTRVEEQAVAEVSTQENNDDVGGLIAESKKYRTRAQAAEAELNELKENLKLQEQKREEQRNKELAHKKEEQRLQELERKKIEEERKLAEAKTKELAAITANRQPVVVQPLTKVEPFYKKWWFWAIVGGAAAAIAGGVWYFSSGEEMVLPSGSLGTADLRGP